jgi:hypothetical protein
MTTFTNDYTMPRPMHYLCLLPQIRIVLYAIQLTRLHFMFTQLNPCCVFLTFLVVTMLSCVFLC